jgi:hypothetical protein
MRASSVSAPTFSARITRPPVPLIVAPMTGSPGPLATGIGSPVTIDSSTLLAALEHHAVDRDFSPGRTRSGRPADLGAARRAPCRRASLMRAPSWRPARAARGCRAGAAAGAQLEHLAEQHQGDDHRGGLEVDADLAAVRRGRRPGRSRAPASRPRCSVGDATPSPISVNMLRLPGPSTRTAAARPAPRPPRNAAHVAVFGFVVEAAFGGRRTGSSAMPQIGQSPGRPGRSRDASGRYQNFDQRTHA